MAEHSPLKPYFDLIWTQRDWSWTVVGIVYLLVAAFVRSWFMAPLLAQTRGMDKRVHYDLKVSYLKRSIPGWILFFIPLGLLIVIWRKDVFPVQIRDVVLGAIALGSFVLSVISHIHAFGISATRMLRLITNREKEQRYDV